MFIILECKSGGDLTWVCAHESEDAALQEAAERKIDPEDMICVVETKYFMQKI